MLRVLSLGAGVQSSTLLLMAAAGELPPLDAWIFADPQWESLETYQWLERLCGVPYEAWWDEDGMQHWRAIPGDYRGGIAGQWGKVVTAGAIRASVYEAKSTGTRYATLPLYTLNHAGQKGRQRRQCTREFKIEPQVHQIRTWINLRPGQRGPKTPVVQQLFGISTDEATRAKDSRFSYITHEHPLLDRGMSRADCEAWCAERGLAPPSSACVGCGYRRDPEWRRMRDESPQEFADAVAFDHFIREGKRGLRAQAFVHDSRRPLDQVDLATPEEAGQHLFDGFANECEGMCGV